MNSSPTPTYHKPRLIPQIDDHRLSKSCGVVGRPDHHCGDDLVVVIVTIVETLLSQALAPFFCACSRKRPTVGPLKSHFRGSRIQMSNASQIKDEALGSPFPKL